MKHRETNFYEDLQKYDKLLSQDFNFESTEVNLERCDINNHKAHYPISKPNQWLHDMLEKELDLPVEYEYALDGYSFDLRIGNILIEYCPTISHNITRSYRWLKGHKDDKWHIDDYHHVKKQLVALKHGMFCFFVWSWDKWEPLVCAIKAMLKPKLDASNCEFQMVPGELAEAWLQDKTFARTKTLRPQQDCLEEYMHYGALVDIDTHKIMQMMSVVYSAHEEARVVNANHYNAANEPAWVVVDNVKTRIVEHGTEILFVNISQYLSTINVKQRTPIVYTVDCSKSPIDLLDIYTIMSFDKLFADYDEAMHMYTQHFAKLTSNHADHVSEFDFGCYSFAMRHWLEEHIVAEHEDAFEQCANFDEYEDKLYRSLVLSGDWFAVNDAGMYTFVAAIIKDVPNDDNDKQHVAQYD